MKSYLGKKIVIGIDRPIGYVHKKDKYSLSEKSNNKDIKRRVFVNEDIKAPVKKGEVLGYVEFVSDGKVIDKVEIVSENEVNKKGIGQMIGDIVKGFM